MLRDQRSSPRRCEGQRRGPHPRTLWPGRNGKSEISGYRPDAKDEESLVERPRRELPAADGGLSGYAVRAGGRCAAAWGATGGGSDRAEAAVTVADYFVASTF